MWASQGMSPQIFKGAQPALMASSSVYGHLTRPEVVAAISAPAHQSHRYKAPKWKTHFLILGTSLEACAACCLRASAFSFLGSFAG